MFLVETRAPLIGSDGKGAKFGTFYVLQTTVDKPEQCFWGHYTHKQDEAGVLTIAGRPAISISCFGLILIQSIIFVPYLFPKEMMASPSKEWLFLTKIIACLQKVW